MKTDETMKSMHIEEVIQVLKTMYPKTTKMVNGRLQGGFDNHDCKEGRALDGAIGALEEMAKLKSLSVDEQVELPKENPVSDKQDSNFWDKVPDNGKNSFAWNTIKRFHDGKVAVVALNEEQWKDFVNTAERIEGVGIPLSHRKFSPLFSREQYGYMEKISEENVLCRVFHRNNLAPNIELITTKNYIKLANELPLAPKPKEINVPGHMGTFKSIDEAKIKDNDEVMTCCLMESVEYGQDANMVVINGDGQLIAQDITSEDVCNWKDIAADCLSEKDGELDLE